MNRMTLSVVVPARNEEASLAATVTELQQSLDEQGIPHEIIVVDDNSTDGTGSVLQSLCQRDPRIRPLTRSAPVGFGRAIRAGLQVVEGDAVIIFMADRSDRPDDAVAYYRKLEEGYDCVFGSRFIRGSRVEGYPWLKLIVNRIVNKCIQWLFWCPFNDLTNAFKAYRTSVIRECEPFQASHFNITIEMSLGALIRRYHIAQIPIGWIGRACGVSKLRMVEMGRRYASTLVRLMAERFLIVDDVIAESLTRNVRREFRVSELEERVRSLEEAVRELRDGHVVNSTSTFPDASGAAGPESARWPTTDPK